MLLATWLPRFYSECISVPKVCLRSDLLALPGRPNALRNMLCGIGFLDVLFHGQ